MLQATSHNHKIALELAAKGIRVFPCRASDGPLDEHGHPQWKAKQPMPRLKWTEGATTDIETINEWWSATPEALVGMPLGPLGLLVLDPDQHLDGPDGIAAFDELARKYPELLGGPYVQTPQGRHYIYLQPPGKPLGNAQGNLPPGINVRGVGGYVIAPGSVLPDGRGWVMHALAKPFPLPQAIVGMISGQLYQSNSEQGFSGTYDIEMTPPADPRRAAYVKQACANAFAKVAQALPGNRNNMLNTQALKLGHFVGAGLLVEYEVIDLLAAAARDAGLDNSEIHPTIHSGLQAGKKEPIDPIQDEDIEQYWDEDDGEAPAAPALRVYKGSELVNIPRQRFLIDGLIPQHTLGLMIGESQTFKSFMAQSMALAIAAGLPAWEGHAIHAPPGAVALYIAGEGGIGSAAKRMEAWAIANSVAVTDLDRFRLITAPIDLLNKASRKQLLQACKDQTDGPIAMIVVDTVNTAIPGGDENSAQDMGMLYAVMRSMSQAFSTTIMGVHHTNKQGKTRGSSVFQQNADFWLFMKRNPATWATMNVELVVGKLKDEPSGAVEHYHLDTVALADRSASLMPKRIGAIQAERTETVAAGRPSSRMDAILEVLRRSQSIDGEPRSEICAILEITETKEKGAVSQCLRRLLAQGLVTRHRSGRWQALPMDTFVTSDFLE